MANAQFEGLNLVLPLIDPQGQLEYVSPNDLDRLLQQGYRRPDPGPETIDPYLRLLEEEAARGGLHAPTIPRPELPRPFRVDFRAYETPPRVPGAEGPAPFDWGQVQPTPLGEGIFRGLTFPNTERTPTGEDVVVAPGGRPVPVSPPTPEEIGADRPRSLNLPELGIRPAITETSPEGVVRLLPHAAQPWTRNEREFIEGYMNAQPPMELTGRRPELPPQPERGSPGDRRYYQYYGDYVGTGDERLAPGEAPYILRPDGTREHAMPRGGAYQPSTGRVFESRGPGVEREGAMGLADALGTTFNETLLSPLRDLGRWGERWERGMVVPDTQLFSEAINIQGMLIAGTASARIAGRAGARADPTEFTLGTAGAGSRTPSPRPEVTIHVEPPNSRGQVNGRFINAQGEDVGTFYARHIRRSREDPGFTQIGHISIDDKGLQRRGLYQAVRDHLEATTGRPHIPDNMLSDEAYNWWLRQDPEAVMGRYSPVHEVGLTPEGFISNTPTVSFWERGPLVTPVIETARTRAVREAFRRGELRSPIGPGGVVTKRAGRPASALYSNPDKPGASAAALAAAQAFRRRTFLDREVDPAGFHLHALEVARRALPESAPTREMIELLRAAGVTNQEMEALRLNQLLRGEGSPHHTNLLEAERALGRAANDLSKAKARTRDYPENPRYRDFVGDVAIKEWRLRRELYLEARENVRRLEALDLASARGQYRHAEAEIKRINKLLRDPTTTNMDPAMLYNERAIARRMLADSKARMKVRNPNERLITSQEIIDHIRTNRPAIGEYVRRMPDEVVKLREAIVEGTRFRKFGQEAGIDPSTVDYILYKLRRQPMSQWGSIGNSEIERIISDGIRSITGKTTDEVVTLYRAAMLGLKGVDTPAYAQATPDPRNPTLTETAVTLNEAHHREAAQLRRERAANMERLRGLRYEVQNRHTAWTAEELHLDHTLRIRNAVIDKNLRHLNTFVTGHWPETLTVAAHMQTSLQRLPRPGSAAIGNRLNKIDDLTREMYDLSSRLLDPRIPNEEFLSLTAALTKAREKQTNLRTKVKGETSGGDLVYVGHQFQSDFAQAVKDEQTTARHPLVESVRSWLRPIVDKFLDQGIRSGTRFIAIPDGRTVAMYNQGLSKGVKRVYDEALRTELDAAMARRGITPVSRQDVTRMYPIDHTYGDPRGHPGSWHVVEVPENAPLGARLFSNPDEPATAAAASSIANISRGPSYNSRLMRVQAMRNESLVHRIRRVQPTETELRNYPRAERIELLQADDPHPGPVIGFHATRRDFDTFDLARSSDIGHHFGTREQATNRIGGIGVPPTYSHARMGSRGIEYVQKGTPMFENARIIPAYLNIRNPLLLPDLGSWDPSEVAHHIVQRVPSRHVDRANRLVDLLDNTPSGILQWENRIAAVRSALDDMGYDSIRYRNDAEGEGWTYIVWQPGLVRSVTNPAHQLYSNPDKPAAAGAASVVSQGTREGSRFTLGQNTVPLDAGGNSPYTYFYYPILRDGTQVGHMRGSVSEGQAYISYIYTPRDVRLSHSDIMSLREAFRRDFPNITVFTGDRVSSSRRNLPQRSTEVKVRSGDPTGGLASLILGGQGGQE